jgi:hypothetical protein
VGLRLTILFTETDFDDAWDDMGPFDGAKLKLRDDSVDDLDAELDSMSFF